jgi:pilin isopeptide linkage protein
MRKLKKFLSLVLAAAMTCSLSMAPVLAEEGSGGDQSNTTNTTTETETEATTETGVYSSSKLPIQKVLDLSAGSSVPTGDFTFKIEPVTVTAKEEITGMTVNSGAALTNDTLTIDMVNGYTSLNQASVDGLKGSVTGATRTEYYDFDKNATWTAAGIYRYTVREDATTNKLSFVETYDDTVFTVDVYVTNHGTTAAPDYKVSYIKAYDKEKHKTPIVFKNTTNTESLVISKKVTDYLNANPDQEFTFWIKIPVGGDSLTLGAGEGFAATKTDANGDKTEYTVKTSPIKVGGKDKDDAGNYLDATKETPSKANGWCSFTLKNGESLAIHDVPVGMIYFLYEEQVGGFDTYEENATEEHSVSSSKSDYRYYKEGQIPKHTIASGNNFETFWNIREMPNSGVVLSVLPYVVIVLVAAAVCVLLLISRKRRNVR